ncbi:hypothetical protein CEQ90_00640 [Lewinellaceae bacterium SD302]|nr:hypothetical protein CEQ90_00640 [Lewinellaceae bacterium SD302]
MIKNWLRPPDLSGIDLETLPDHSVGKNLLTHQLRQRELRKLTIGIVGLDANIAKKLRASFYKLAWDFDDLKLADLGDVRKNHPDFIIPLLRELKNGGILPLLIGGEASGFRAQYQAFQETERQVSILMIDQLIRLTTDNNRVAANVLNPAVHAKRKRLFHLSHIGSQRHLVDPAIYDLLESRSFNYVRLGEARSDLSELEPVIRDADLLGLDISSVTKFEAPAQFSHQPSGFDLTELTQLCRYAGMSDKLQSFGIYGVNMLANKVAVPTNERNDDGFATNDSTTSDQDIKVTAAAAAQLLWYFVDGFANRKGDFPASSKGLLEYVVDLKDYDPITFWKSPKSGRWWIQAPAGKKNGEERHRLIPCSYKDYLDAVEQKIPERLIQAFRRYE